MRGIWNFKISTPSIVTYVISSVDNFDTFYKDIWYDLMIYSCLLNVIDLIDVWLGYFWCNACEDNSDSYQGFEIIHSCKVVCHPWSALIEQYIIHSVAKFCRPKIRLRISVILIKKCVLKVSDILL